MLTLSKELQDQIVKTTGYRLTTDFWDDESNVPLLPVDVGMLKAKKRLTSYIARRKKIESCYDGKKQQVRMTEATDRLLQDLMKIFAENT